MYTYSVTFMSLPKKGKPRKSQTHLLNYESLINKHLCGRDFF